MSRSRSSEVLSQRQSPRVPLHLKTTAASEANSLHRLNTDRVSPKPDDHRSPRGVAGGAFHRPHDKKRGTKVADLETRLGHAQEELKKLKDQLASAEAAKRDAEQELQETKKQIPATTTAEEEEETTHEPEQQQEEEEKPKINTEPPASTDVFEVVPCPAAPSEIEGDRDEKIESLEKSEVKEAMLDVKVEEKREFPDVTELRAKLAEKEKELEIRLVEKEALTKQASEAAESARAKEEELWAKVGRVEEELRESRGKGERLGEKLDAAEEAKEALVAEMKKLRVQSEQWRKAAEAAAAVLSAGEGGGRSVGERCGSMDKHLSSSGYGSVWSPVMEEIAAGAAGGGKRKSSGIRMFGDLWKKKGQH